MKESLRTEVKNFAKVGRNSVIAGGVLGLAGVGAITWHNHREKTHQSIKTHPLVELFARTEEKTIGMDPNIWASVHRIHHDTPDATLYPFYRFARAIEWIRNNPDKSQGITLPDQVPYFDPFVDAFTFDQTMEIGKFAVERVRERLGDSYKPPANLTHSEVVAILYPQEPQYYYPDYHAKKAEYTQDDVAQILLTDPHSPALAPPKDGEVNGVRDILLHNVARYKQTANLFKARPDLRPTDLQTDHDVANENVTKAVVAGFVATGTAALLARRKFRIKDVAIAAAAGSAANGIRMGTEIVGGNVTNSLGHGGSLVDAIKHPVSFVRTVGRSNLQLILNEDGSLSTDTSKSGMLGKILSWVTFDEVGGQDEHHHHPDKIAYTSKTGWRKAVDAPWGTFTEFLANSGIPILERGNAFSELDGQRRPDETNPAVLLIQAIRIGKT